MSDKVTSYVCTAKPDEIATLEELLRDRGWEFSAIPYAHWKATNKAEKVNVAAYTSGKLTVQGGGTADFVQFILEPEILHSFGFGYEEEKAAAAAVEEGPILPHGGVDESGKGDFFGPLIIAGVYVDERTGPLLRKIGCCDSKLIKSSRKIAELAMKIREIARGQYVRVALPPPTYNRLYSQIGNLNRLLAWGHARVIENLLEQVPGCPRVLSDKFGDERLIRRALLTRGREIQLDQQTKAESDVAVAAASILARDEFLRGMDKLGKEFGLELPRGAGPLVKEAGRKLLSMHGPDVLEKVVKLHFKTTQELQ